MESAPAAASPALPDAAPALHEPAALANLIERLAVVLNSIDRRLVDLDSRVQAMAQVLDHWNVILSEDLDDDVPLPDISGGFPEPREPTDPL